MPVNSVVRVVELPKRCRIRPRRPRCGRRRLSRAELAPHLMPGNQPSHGLRARHQLYLPRQLGAGAAVSPHKRASHAAQAAAAARRRIRAVDGMGGAATTAWSRHPRYLQRRQAAFTVLQQAILEVPLEGCCALQHGCARGLGRTSAFWGSLSLALRTNLASAWPQDTPLDPCSTLRPAGNDKGAAPGPLCSQGTQLQT